MSNVHSRESRCAVRFPTLGTNSAVPTHFALALTIATETWQSPKYSACDSTPAKAWPSALVSTEGHTAFAALTFRPPYALTYRPRTSRTADSSLARGVTAATVVAACASGAPVASGIAGSNGRDAKSGAGMAATLSLRKEVVCGTTSVGLVESVGRIVTSAFGRFGGHTTRVFCLTDEAGVVAVRGPVSRRVTAAIGGLTFGLTRLAAGTDGVGR